MTRSKQAKQSAAKKRSWQPGGAHRIAHEQRLQDKKTAPLVHRTSQPASAVIGHQEAENAFNSLLMYRAACLLLMSAEPRHRKQAHSLIAAADALLGDDQ